MNTLLFCLDVFALSLCAVYGFWLAERWWEEAQGRHAAAARARRR